MSDQEHGFSLWVILTESEARAIAQSGEYPDRIRIKVQKMLSDHDAHLQQCQDVLEKRTTKTMMRA